MDATARRDGYAPIRDYAAIGDGRTVALVARDGAIDWLCLPDLDSPSAFGALLDSSKGGSFALTPEGPYEATRRYVPGTNVLETTFTTSSGSVQVTDALTLPTHGLAPYRELVRRVEGLAGSVPLRWRLEPRFQYGGARTELSLRAGVPVASHGRDAVAVATWNAGDPRIGPDAVESRFAARVGEVGHLVLAAAHQEPLVFPSRDDVEARLGGTIERWRAWAEGREYDGRWPEAVLRSALALKLLVFAPSGAIAAAPTTSLPEELGGARNWDYRYSWPRDASFALRALLALGCDREATAFFWWLLHASQLTQPKVRSLYCLDGGSEAGETTLSLDGYRRSRPVRSGNAAAMQSQLDVYGDVLDAATELAARSGGVDRDHAKRLAAMADFVCGAWSERDSGIWEARSEPRHYTQSKLMCFVALDRACALADQGLVEGDAARWSSERERIRKFVDERCWSEAKQSYVCSADDDALDASLLLGVIAGFGDPRAPRLVGTVDRIREELGRGPLLRRYAMDDGLEGEEGAFLACSFWLAEAYALQGRLEEAVALMDELVGLANDVGLYSEEIDPESGEFLGNFPQGLSHLALINAAVAIERAER